MRFNQYFANHFGGCLLLTTTYDPHRQRKVELRMIPGEFTFVGVTDGTDCWIAPVISDPFSAGVGRILEGIKNGKMPGQQRPQRHTVYVAPEELPQEAPQKTRRAVVVAPEGQSPTPAETNARRRVHVRA